MPPLKKTIIAKSGETFYCDHIAEIGPAAENLVARQTAGNSEAPKKEGRQTPDNIMPNDYYYYCLRPGCRFTWYTWYKLKRARVTGNTTSGDRVPKHGCRDERDMLYNIVYYSCCFFFAII